MAPQYVNLGNFTVVLTPHFRIALHERRHLLCDARFDSSHWNKVWRLMSPDITYGYKLGLGYAYCKAKYNIARNRWELEYISFTPSDKFHTRNRPFAQLLCFT